MCHGPVGTLVLAAALAALGLTQPLNAQQLPDRISLSDRDLLTMVDPDSDANRGVIRPPYDGPGALPRGGGGACRQLGDYFNAFFGTNRLRGNVVKLNVGSAVLNEFRMELDFDSGDDLVPLTFAVYGQDGDSVEGLYFQEILKEVEVTGVVGRQFYSSGELKEGAGLTMTADWYYILLVAWGDPGFDITFAHDGLLMPYDFELGTVEARVVTNNPFPLENEEAFTFDSGLFSVGAYSMQMCMDPLLGACCIEGSDCMETVQTMCKEATGSFAGELTDCEPDPCPLPIGACCPPKQPCEVGTQFDCEDQEGEYLGDGSSCTGDPCIPIGSCCLDDETCDEVSEADCDDAGGEYGGDDTECTPELCVIPSGACCADGECFELTHDECDGLPGAYMGDDTSCDDSCAVGACCLGEICFDGVNQVACKRVGGTYLGHGSVCNPEASCECTVDADCPEGETCDPETAECVPSCEGDANGDGLVDPLDSGFVLARFGCPVGTGDPGCDTADQNGDGLVDPLDVGFVLARFGPCP